MKKRILVIQRDPLLSGVQKVFLSEYECLKDSYDYYLICSCKGPLMEVLKLEKTFTVNEMKRKISLVSDIRAVFKIFLIVRQIKPDIIHTHSTKPGIYAALLKLAFNFKLIHTVHGFSFHTGQNYIKYKIFSIIEGFFGKFREMNIVLTQRDYKKAVSIGFLPHRIKCVPNAPNRTRLTGEVEKIKNSFCWIGRFELQKDPMTFVKAAVDYINVNGDGAYFEMWGEGSLRAVMELEVRKLPRNLEKSIRIKGWCENPIETMSRHENYVTTSTYEGMPLVLLEAMVANCNIIATNIEEHRETMDGQNATYYNIRGHVELNKIFSDVTFSKKSILKNYYRYKTPEERAVELQTIYMEL